MHTWWFQIVPWYILLKIKYIFMATFSIHLLILKKVKPNEVRKNVYHLLRYLLDFYVILWPLKLNNYSLIHPNIEKLYIFWGFLYKMVYFLLFGVIAMWQLTWPDHFYICYEFFSMLHIHFLTVTQGCGYLDCNLFIQHFKDNSHHYQEKLDNRDKSP